MENSQPVTWYWASPIGTEPEHWIKEVQVVCSTELYIFVDDGCASPHQFMRKGHAGAACFPTREEAVQHVKDWLTADVKHFNRKQAEAMDRLDTALEYFSSL